MNRINAQWLWLHPNFFCVAVFSRLWPQIPQLSTTPTYSCTLLNYLFDSSYPSERYTTLTSSGLEGSTTGSGVIGGDCLTKKNREIVGFF